MTVYTYDGTFEGFLSTVFECFSTKAWPNEICSSAGRQAQFFADKCDVQTDSAKSDRVWTGIQNKMSARNSQLLFYAFLSEENGIEMQIFHFIRRLFREKINIETDFGDPCVLHITQVARKVKREAMRIMQFVRFQHTADDMYFCGIEPGYDIIPLVAGHFQHRFASQRWLLYDLKRNYGIVCENNKIEEVEITKREFNAITGQVNSDILQEDEIFYQKLWKSYFKHINISERKNLKLQRRNMPLRFWKYLPEMQG